MRAVRGMELVGKKMTQDIMQMSNLDGTIEQLAKAKCP